MSQYEKAHGSNGKIEISESGGRVAIGIDGTEQRIQIGFSIQVIAVSGAATFEIFRTNYKPSNERVLQSKTDSAGEAGDKEWRKLTIDSVSSWTLDNANTQHFLDVVGGNQLAQAYAIVFKATAADTELNVRTCWN